MMAKVDLDFDPYERDMAEFFEAGRKEGATDVDRQRQANRARKLDLLEEQQAAQRRREVQRSTPEPAPEPSYSAPSLSVPGVSSLGVGTGGPDRATSARIIVVIVVLSAVGTVAHDAIVGASPAKTTVQVGNGTVTVPTHLRTLGAVLVMGTIALIVNEVDPGIGLVLGVALGLDVAVNTLLGVNGLFTRLQGGIFGKGVSPLPAGAKPTTSSSGGSQTTKPTTTIPGFNGLPGVGPAGLSQPQYHWNGKTWVPVTSTTQP